MGRAGPRFHALSPRYKCCAGCQPRRGGAMNWWGEPERQPGRWGRGTPILPRDSDWGRGAWHGQWVWEARQELVPPAASPSAGTEEKVPGKPGGSSGRPPRLAVLCARCQPSHMGMAGGAPH